MSGTHLSCAYHEDVPAIAVCTDCGGDICGECHGITAKGLALCRNCRGDFLIYNVPWEARRPGPTVLGFFATALAALSSPRTFFLHMERQGRWAPAAIFGMLAIALGSLFTNLWQKIFAADYGETVARYAEELGTSVTMAEFAIFATIPFGAVLLYLSHTALLYCSLKVFGVEQADWSLVARISGYSLAAYLLFIFPPMGEFNLGHFLMVVWLFNLEVSAVRWFFAMGFWRSMGVVLLPLALFLLTVG